MGLLSHRREGSTPGAAPWLLTYADCMGLLLCVFVVLFSMGGLTEGDHYSRMRQSIQAAFGASAGEVDRGRSGPPRPKLIERLMSISPVPGSVAATSNQEVVAQSGPLSVTTDEQGLRIELAGEASFEKAGAGLRGEARALIAEVARRIHDYEQPIEVRGHAGDDEAEKDAETARDVRDLSYERARAVAEELEANGVARHRIILVAAGAAEPLANPASEDARGAERRVEILVREDSTSEGAHRATQ